MTTRLWYALRQTAYVCAFALGFGIGLAMCAGCASNDPHGWGLQRCQPLERRAKLEKFKPEDVLAGYAGFVGARTSALALKCPRPASSSSAMLDPIIGWPPFKFVHWQQGKGLV